MRKLMAGFILGATITGATAQTRPHEAAGRNTVSELCFIPDKPPNVDAGAGGQIQRGASPTGWIMKGMAPLESTNARGAPFLCPFRANLGAAAVTQLEAFIDGRVTTVIQNQCGVQ